MQFRKLYKIGRNNIKMRETNAARLLMFFDGRANLRESCFLIKHTRVKGIDKNERKD